MRFINGSGLYFNTIHSADFNFFREINKVIQEEPSMQLTRDPWTARGDRHREGPTVRSGRTNEEDSHRGGGDRKRHGPRALTFRPRDKANYFYPGESSWTEPFVGGSHEFIRNNARLLDARAGFFFFASGISPQWREDRRRGSQYAMATVDAEGNYLDGERPTVYICRPISPSITSGR